MTTANNDINKERVLETFLELVQIDSPSGHEAAVAAYCKKVLEDAGCAVHFDNAGVAVESNTGNLFATLPSFDWSAPLPIYLSAHMDTVEPGRGVKPEVRDGYVYSDGTTVLGGDDKVGIAATIEVVRCLAEGARQGMPHPEIRVMFSVQEEQGLLGAKAMEAGRFADTKGALCYVLDAAGAPGLVVNGAPYQYSYRALYQGLAAHAGIAPEAGISAIETAAHAIAALPHGRIDEQTTANVGTIAGGIANNIVAEECLVTGEIRSHNEASIRALKTTVHEVLTAAAQPKGERESAEVSIEWEVNYEGFFAPKDSPQVAHALRAAEHLGLESKTEISGGGADTNILASYGLAAVSLGCGMDRVHTTEERLALADLWNLASLVLQICLQR